MRKPFRLSGCLWMIIPLGACVFVLWAGTARSHRVNYVSGLASDVLQPDATSQTGYAGGLSRMILPAHNDAGYHWIIQTQQMLARGEWRVRHIDYENAPFGHPVTAASPYRWWLGLVAWCDHILSGRPLGASTERAALFADPLLHVIVIAGAAAFVASQAGAFPAALLTLGLVGFFPWAALFLGGSPDDHALAGALALASVLPLLTAVCGGRAASTQPAPAARRSGRWFFGAGVVGGLALWVSVPTEVPVIAGIALGAVLAAMVWRVNSAPGAPAGPGLAEWRAWAFGGAVATLGAYLVEYFPSHMASWELRSIHPLYGLAWLGAGELLGRAVAAVRRQRLSWGIRDFMLLGLAIAAVAALPIVMWKTKNPGFLDTDLAALRLTRWPADPPATSLWAWLVHSDLTFRAFVAFSPLLLVLPAIWLLLRRGGEPACRAGIALALGPIAVAVGFACVQLRWWSLAGGLLLLLMVAATSVAWPARAGPRKGWWGVMIGALVACGLVQLVPLTGATAGTAVNETEFMGLIERDLSQFLARHSEPGGAIALAPPNQTAAFFFYGGVRGLGSLSWENRDGLGLAVRIVSASTTDEAKALIDGRGVTHIILPSWDASIDEFARMGMGQLEGTFLDRLRHWVLPPWLRPVPYQLPAVPGFEGQSVTLLKVVEEQDDPVAQSRIAEYFVEMGDLDRAASRAEALRRYPADFGAWVARAQVETARGDEAGLAASFKVLLPRLKAGGDRRLPWDRRVGLAVVLAQGKHVDLAREQVRRCVKEMDAARLRSVSTGALYRLLVLSKAFEIPVADPALHELALKLLPPESRNRL